jgi:hypothetical protein
MAISRRRPSRPTPEPDVTPAPAAVTECASGLCGAHPVADGVSPEVNIEVLSWLGSRAVGSVAVRGNTLVVVSWPDVQKATWRL